MPATQEPEIIAARPWWQGPGIWAVAFLFMAAYNAAAHWWYLDFIWGRKPGPYWLLMVFSWSPIPVGLLLVVVIPLALAGWSIWQRARKHPGPVRLRHVIPASIVGGLLIAPATFVLMITPFRHADTLDAAGKRYHLAQIEALIDRNFAVYECDGLSLWCRQIVRSSDYPMSGSSAHFETDPSTGDLKVIVCTAYGSLPSCRSTYTFHP